MPKTGKLMGMFEIRDRLGVSRQRAHDLTRSKDFPEPYDEIALGRVWLTEDVEAWLRWYRPHLTQTDD